MRSLKTILERENQEDLELFASDYLEGHFTSKKEMIKSLEEKKKTNLQYLWIVSLTLII